MGNATSNNPLALFIRWQTSVLNSRLGLRLQPRYALAKPRAIRRPPQVAADNLDAVRKPLERRGVLSGQR
jgi:hypothetical protein